MLFTNLRLLDRQRFDPIVLLSGHGPAEALLEELGIEYKIWGPLTEPGNHLNYLRALFRTLFWFKRQKIELVHLNRANAWRPAELLALRISGIPVVTHFHTVNLDRAPCTRWSSAIAAVSNYVAQHSDTQGVPTTVIYNTVDTNRFSNGQDMRSQFGIANDQIVVGFVGQIRKIKGVDDFIGMAKHIAGDHVRFLIAGECRDKKSIDDAFTREELQSRIVEDPRIIYCGYVDNVEDIYRSTDILVVPSRWEEPFGLICIEAGAAGLPVIATRQGGLPEVIEDGITGLIVAAGAVLTMAHQVQKLVEDPKLRAAMGEAARIRVEREFTDKPVRALEDLYVSLLANGN